ncbi:MAG TPA: hypothetical protein VKS03_09010 [Thermoanaerobaculia bacterium]|nr:hypothetical protein [Thermoanaerobaculia bacterium]
MARIIAVPDVETPLVPPIVISKKAHQEIVWRLSAGSTLSYVKITLGKNPLPFDNCQEMSGACRINCQNHVCLSGPIKESLSVPPEGLSYNYDFRRADSTASADPEIRIDP